MTKETRQTIEENASINGQAAISAAILELADAIRENTKNETAILVAITGVLTDEELMRIQHRLKKQEMYPAVEWLTVEMSLREKEENNG